MEPQCPFWSHRAPPALNSCQSRDGTMLGPTGQLAWVCVSSAPVASPLGPGWSVSLGFCPSIVVCAVLVSPVVGLLHRKRLLKLSFP